MIWPKRETYFHIRLILRTVMRGMHPLYLNTMMLKFGGKFIFQPYTHIVGGTR
jgi:hypothetical protein